MLEEFVEKFASQIKQEVLKDANIEQSFPLELTREECAKMLGCSVNTFDKRFRNAMGFPVCSNGKYPRDAVRAWYAENWDEI